MKPPDLEVVISVDTTEFDEKIKRAASAAHKLVEHRQRRAWRARWNAAARKRRLRKIRLVRRGHGGCSRHVDLLALHAEPNGNNPAKLIGYVCRTCTTIFTPNLTPSVPTVERAHFAGAIERPSRSHAARLRAVDRLGIVDLSPAQTTLEAA